VLRSANVEFEGPVMNLHRDGGIELAYCEFELTLAEITEGADDVAPNIDTKYSAHPTIVTQSPAR
jgi:hypothetical protein